jgi:hypothetical protein
MKIETTEFRKKVTDRLRSGRVKEDNDVSKFVNFVQYYCADTKETEFEVLYDDKLYSRVCSLYSSTYH